MKNDAPCPDASSLQDLLAGAVSAADQQRLDGHIDGCRCCQQTLDRLSASTWDDAARCLAPEGPNSWEPKLQELVTRMLGQASTPNLSTSDSRQDDPCPPTSVPEANQPSRLGAYHLLERVGRGGFGQVFKARDERLDRIVAIKILAPTLAATAAARRRFLREAKAAAAVCHDHIVGIHAVEEHDGLPYLVMQYVDGVSLQGWLDRSGPLDVKDTLRIGMQIAAGLAAAHAQGLIHRDIKPSNILLESGVRNQGTGVRDQGTGVRNQEPGVRSQESSDNSALTPDSCPLAPDPCLLTPIHVKITDFGLARAVDDTGGSQKGLVVGTPEYMAPEQARGEAVDPRADLFSLGGVLYALCTGRPPFTGKNTPAVLKSVCDDTPRPIRDLNPEVPGWLVAIIDKLLAKDPADRFQSATEVAEALAQHRAPRPQRVRRWLVAAAVVACVGVAAAVVTPQIIIRIRDQDGHVTETKVAKDARVELIENGKVIATVPAVVSTSGSLRLFDKHPGEVQCVAISPDGKRLLIGRRDATMHMLDAYSGKELRVFPGHGDIIWGVAFSPDGRQALSCCRDKVVRHWDVESGRVLRSMIGHTGEVTGAAFCADGKRALSGSADKTVRLWDLESGQELHCFEEHTDCVRCLTLSPDGKRLLSGSNDRSLRLWNLEDRRELQCFPGHQTWVWCAAFAADGRSVLSGSGTHNRDIDGSPFDCRVRLWDVETGKLVRQFTGHDREVTSVAFCAKGRQVLSAGADGVARLWDANTGALMHRFIGHRKTISSMACAADERHFITGSFDSSVRVWELPTTTK